MMESKSIKAASARVGVRLTIVEPSAIDVNVRELTSLEGDEGSKDMVLDVVSKNIDNNLRVDNVVYMEHKWDEDKNIEVSGIGEAIHAYKMNIPIKTSFNEYKDEVTIATYYN